MCILHSDKIKLQHIGFSNDKVICMWGQVKRRSLPHNTRGCEASTLKFMMFIEHYNISKVYI